MKKKNIHINLLIILLFSGTLFFVPSCKEENKGVPSITSVSLRFDDTLQIHAADSLLAANDGALTDTLDVKRWIVIKGINLTPTRHIYINDYDVAFNPNLTTDNYIILYIPNTVPTTTPDFTAPENIRVVTPEGEASIRITVRAPVPSIKSISNEFANKGDIITIYGADMVNVQNVLFPGDIPGTGIVASTDGTYVKVKVPGGITQGGDLKVVCLAGIAKSAFRDGSTIFAGFEKGIDKDFQNWGFSYGIKEIDGSISNPPVPVINGNYMEMTNFDGTHWQTIPAPMWWDGNFECVIVPDFTSVLQHIPASTSASNLAFKFEFYSTQNWNSGGYTIDFNDTWDFATRMLYWPYFDPDLTKRQPLKTTDWVTVTIPLSDFYPGRVNTLADISGSTELHWFYWNWDAPNATTGIGNMQQGKNYTGAAVEKFDVFFDNLRIVKIK